MSEVSAPPVADGFVPGEADIEEVLDWFARYDAHIAAGDVDAMADMALFPINEVTDGAARSVTREEFVQQMREMTGQPEEVSMESTRTPHFLSRGLVFVSTDATISAQGQTHTVRYGDLLVKVADQWRFQTMVQGGWGDL